jgi:hypothetical protein
MTDSNQGHHLGVSDRHDQKFHPDTGHEHTRTRYIDEHEVRTTAPATVMTRHCTVVASTPPLAQDDYRTGGNHVVVTIGIDQYAAWSHLGNAVNDARGTSEVFRSLGFTDVCSLIDETATGDAMRKLVTDDLSTLGVNDSLVIFFAGHGGTMTRVLQDGTTIKTGFIIPVDAQNKQGQVATWIRLDTWLDDIARLPPKHILVILDACHSGIALDALVKWRDINTWQSDPADELSRRRSRRVIVSALDDQLALDGGPVVGHSLFTGCLIQALTGGLPREGRQTATGTELGIHLQRRVKDYPNSRQTPDFGAFELDDRGELLIPLFPLVLKRITSPLPSVNTDTNAALRHRLAVTLEEIVPDRTGIAQLVAAHASMISVTDLPVGTAVTIWIYVLVELSNRGSFSEMSAVVNAVRSRSRRSRRIDWSVFDAVLSPPAVPAVASWSHLSLELRRDNTDADRAGSTLITDGDTLLQVVSTLRWGGVRPSDPLIEVTSYQLFGRTMPLLHEATLLPSPSPGTASWLAKIPVPRARIRTRRVTVRCVGTDLMERRYLVPRAGSICAAIVWLAFAAFAWYWLSPISRILITAPLTAFGVLSGLWSSVGVHLLRVSHNKRSFRSLLFAWELAVLVAALAAMLVIVVPPHLIVLVTNTMQRDVKFDNSKISIAAGTSKQVLPVSVSDWRPVPPFCRCDLTPGCQDCGQAPPVRGFDHLVFGCNAGDCTHIIEQADDGGTATIVRPIGIDISPLVFEAGVTTPRMRLQAGDRVVTVNDVTQAKGATMKLAILPAGKSYSIEFANQGTLQCDARATRIIRFALEQPATQAGRIDITIGATHSLWTAMPGSGEARACADKPVDSAQTLTLSTPDDMLKCEGGPVERVVSLEVAPPDTKLWVKIGDIETSWSSKTRAKSARGCLGKQGDIELAQLAPGVHVTLPRDLTFSQVRVRRDRADPRSAVRVRCHTGDTVRAVKLVGVDARQTISVGNARVEPLSPTTGVTCDDPASQRDHNRIWELQDTTLTYKSIYEGDCQLQTNDKPRAGGKTDECPSLASPADKQRARRMAAARNLICWEVYQCE